MSAEPGPIGTLAAHHLAAAPTTESASWRGPHLNSSYATRRASRTFVRQRRTVYVDL
jgi:hypothetical protein